MREILQYINEKILITALEYLFIITRLHTDGLRDNSYVLRKKKMHFKYLETIIINMLYIEILSQQ